jgi:hypothetical protein
MKYPGDHLEVDFQKWATESTSAHVSIEPVAPPGHNASCTLIEDGTSNGHKRKYLPEQRNFY